MFPTIERTCSNGTTKQMPDLTLHGLCKGKFSKNSSNHPVYQIWVRNKTENFLPTELTDDLELFLNTYLESYYEGAIFDRIKLVGIDRNKMRGLAKKTSSITTSEYVGVSVRVRNNIQYNKWTLQNKELEVSESHEYSDNKFTEYDVMMMRNNFIIDNNLEEYFRLNMCEGA